MKFAEGYNTQVGEDGMSVGKRRWTSTSDEREGERAVRTSRSFGTGCKI